MSELNLLPIYQMITKESILFFHKVVFDNQPAAITQYISFSLSNSQNCRQSRKSLIKENHPSKKMYQTIIHTSGRGRLWGPALGVVKTLHTDNKQHKENMKT